MFTTTVRDPQNNQWSVSLQIIPHRYGIGLKERFIRRRAKKHNSDKFGWQDLVPIPDGLDDILLIIGFLVFVAFFIFVGWPLLLLLTDFAWLLIVLLGALISFGTFGRPITVLAQNGNQTRSWKVRGFIRALKLRTNIAQNLAQGAVIPEENEHLA